MAFKRKFEHDTEDIIPINAKQLKLIPFPTLSTDDDVAMSEAGPIYAESHHIRFASNASSESSNASSSPNSSPSCPSFDIRPLPFFDQSGTTSLESYTISHSAGQSSKSVGLLQPSTSFAHHGNCSQIPKLRIACAPGLHGQRTMWSFCEQCGAISMVESD